MPPWPPARARPGTDWRVPRRSAPACLRARSGRAIPADCHWDQKIQFPTGEDPLLPMIQVLDPDLPLPKQLARPYQGLRAHRERVMDLRILDKSVINRRGTLAEQDMVVTDSETRHQGVAAQA